MSIRSRTPTALPRSRPGSNGRSEAAELAIRGARLGQVGRTGATFHDEPVDGNAAAALADVEVPGGARIRQGLHRQLGAHIATAGRAVGPRVLSADDAAGAAPAFALAPGRPAFALTPAAPALALAVAAAFCGLALATARSARPLSVVCRFTTRNIHAQ